MFKQKILKIKLKKCKVSSFVLGNTANIVSSREILNNEREFEGLTYECSAHILHLLAKDLVKTDIIKHVTNILKYFQKHSFIQKVRVYKNS